MNPPLDPFTYHPELRDKITDPLTSFFRDFDIKSIMLQHPELTWAVDMLYDQQYRDAVRHKTLASSGGDDLWVFGYGSLMWDPAFLFKEIRRAHVPDFERKFILTDIMGGRGNRDNPGLFAALDAGMGCDGLAYRIAKEHVETESEILFRREMIAPGYIPTFVTALVDDNPIQALTFVANHAADVLQPNLTHEEQIRLIATGKGILGTSFEYLQNIVSHFAALGVVDEHCTVLLRDVESFMQAAPSKPKSVTT